MSERLPKDPVMLLSVINTRLRDRYPSLDILCEESEIDKEELCQILEGIDYVYEPKRNQFI